MPRRDILLPVLLVLAAFAVYSNGLEGEFLYDDRPYIVENPQVDGQASIFGSGTPPGREDLGLFRPFFVLTLRLNVLMDGLKPSLFHGTNLLVYMSGILALFFLVRKITGDTSVAFLGALLFTVHPAHVEAVTWIVGRAELLSFFFCLLCALAHFKAKEKPWFRILEGAAFLLAGLSKENALVFPLVLWLLDVSAFGSGEPGLIQRTVKKYWIYVPLVIGLLIWRYAVLGRLHPAVETAPFRDVGLFGRMEVALSALAEYLRLFVFPYPLKIFYHSSEIRHLDPLRVIILLLFFASIFMALKRRSPAAGWLLWIPAALLPVLNLVPIGAVFAERFFLLPSAGACVAASLAMMGLIRKEILNRKTHHSVWIPAVAVLCFAVLTYARNPVFDNAFKLWKDAVNKGGQYAFPHYNLGECYFEKQMYEIQSPETWGAVRELEESLRLNPDHPYAFAAHYRLGQYYLKLRYENRGELEGLRKAAIHFEMSLTLGPPVKEQYRSALYLVRIHLDPKGSKLVSLEAALKFLALAIELGAPEKEWTPVQRALQESVEKNKEGNEKVDRR